ncbi:MAG: hypothetical protein AAGA16_21115, partial [Cyanobacteria bacterium P01_E01_bin.35]
FQYSVYEVIVNNKSSYRALKYSSDLVINSPWQSFLVLSISLMGLFGTDYISILIINALIKLKIFYLFLWILSFIFQMLSSFFILANIICYFNIDYAYQRSTNNT